MTTKTKVIIATGILLLILVGVNLSLNMQPVTFFIWPVWEFQMSKSTLVLVSFVKGSLLTLLAQWYWRRMRARSGDSGTPTPSVGSGSPANPPSL